MDFNKILLNYSIGLYITWEEGGNSCPRFAPPATAVFLASHIKASAMGSQRRGATPPPKEERPCCWRPCRLYVANLILSSYADAAVWSHPQTNVCTQPHPSPPQTSSNNIHCQILVPATIPQTRDHLMVPQKNGSTARSSEATSSYTPHTVIY